MTSIEQVLQEQTRYLPPAEARIENACFRYLSKLGYSLWANWEIQRAERRRLASKWFSLQMRNVIEQMDEDEWAALLKMRPLGTRKYHSLMSRTWAWWHTNVVGRIADTW